MCRICSPLSARTSRSCACTGGTVVRRRNLCCAAPSLSRLSHLQNKTASYLHYESISTMPPPLHSSYTSWEEEVHTQSEWRIPSLSFAMEVEGRAPPATHFLSGWISLCVNAAWSVVDADSNWLDGDYLLFSETRCIALFTLNVCVNVNICVNFNIVLMVMQTLMQKMDLNPFSACAFTRHHSLNTKLDTNVDVDAIEDVKCKQTITKENFSCPCLWVPYCVVQSVGCVNAAFSSLGSMYSSGILNVGEFIMYIKSGIHVLTRNIKCWGVDHVDEVRYSLLIRHPEVLVVEKLWRHLLGVYFEPDPEIMRIRVKLSRTKAKAKSKTFFDLCRYSI